MASRLQQARDFDPYGKGVTLEDLKKIRRQLSKVMNQRMVRLEQAKSPITGESYTYGSYDKIQQYLTQKGRAPIKGSPDVRRFSEQLEPGMSKRELQKEISALQNFEAQVSSRVAGQKQIERARIKTMTEEGLDPSTAKSKDFYDFLNSKTYEALLKSFTSEDIIEEYDKKAQKEKITGAEIAESFRKYVEEESGRRSLKSLRKSLGTTTIKKKKRFKVKRIKKK